MEQTEKKKRGRPSTYDPKVCAELCERIALGRSLSKVCLDDDMPHIRTAMNWMNQYPEFLQNYDEARVKRTDALAEEMFDIARDVTPDMVAVAKLQIDTFKWNLARMNSKRYGDKQQTDITSNGETIQHTEIKLIGVSSDGKYIDEETEE